MVILEEEKAQSNRIDHIYQTDISNNSISVVNFRMSTNYFRGVKHLN